MKRFALPWPALFLLAACSVRGPVTNQLTLQIVDRGRIRVTAVTEISSQSLSAPMSKRMASLREALLAGRDEWGLRFSGVNCEAERIVFEKSHGELQRVEHEATLDRDDLQRLLSDLPITVSFTSGSGWSELAIYPGESTRATREQKEAVERALAVWSRDVARYFSAMHRLYTYADANPIRSGAVFELLVESDDDRHSTVEQEDALIDDAKKAMTAVVDRLDASKSGAFMLDEEFDLVFNPFPAEITIRVPRDIIAIENLDKTSPATAVIRRAGLLEAAEALQGKWLSPDPLAMAIRNDENLTAEKLASLPRTSAAVVTADEIQRAFLEKLRPRNVYRVRWVE